jgi:hypothetical protein
MASASPPDQDPSAKDFAETLRTVHLSLLAVCLGLGVVAFSPAPYAIRKANQDLRNIADAVSVAHWSTTWLFEAGAEKAAEEPVCKWPPHGPSGLEILGRIRAVDVSGPSWAINVTDWPTNIKRFYLDPPKYEVSPPTDLAQFKRLWDVHAVLFCPGVLPLKLWTVYNGEFQGLGLREAVPPKSAAHIFLCDWFRLGNTRSSCMNQGTQSIPSAFRATTKDGRHFYFPCLAMPTSASTLAQC